MPGRKAGPSCSAKNLGGIAIPRRCHPGLAGLSNLSCTFLSSRRGARRRRTNSTAISTAPAHATAGQAAITTPSSPYRSPDAMSGPGHSGYAQPPVLLTDPQSRWRELASRSCRYQSAAALVQYSGSY